MQLGKGSILMSIHLNNLEMVQAQKNLIDLVDSSLKESIGTFQTQNTWEMSGKGKTKGGKVG